MRMEHVITGLVFTIGGIWSVVDPSVPVICIGALIFGPIEMLYGFIASE